MPYHMAKPSFIQQISYCWAFSVINRAEANVLYYSPILSFLKENCWAILTNNFAKPSFQFMCPSATSNNASDLNGRSTLGFVPFFLSPAAVTWSLSLLHSRNISVQIHKFDLLASQGLFFPVLFWKHKLYYLLPIFHPSHCVLSPWGTMIIS